MRRVLSATCLAATFAVGLAAQSTGTSGTAGTATSQDPQPGQRGGGPRTVTGCLKAGETAGTYMLTDVVMPGGGRRAGEATSTGGTTAGSTTGAGTTAGSTTGAGTTAGGTTTGTGTGTEPQSGRAMAPQSIMLNAASDVDLKPHVGHKIEVTGTIAGGRGQGGDATGSATGTATGTAGTTAVGGTTASGSATGTGTGASASSGGRGPRTMTVTTVRMISESCS